MLWLVHKTSDADIVHSAQQEANALDLKRTRILEVKKTLYPRDDTAASGRSRMSGMALKKTVNGHRLYPALQLRRGRYQQFVKSFTT